MKKLLILIACIVTGIAACKKGGNPLQSPPGDYADFLKNTEWVGVLDGNGYQYPPPCCLRFNPDNTITMHAPFWFNDNGVYVTPDSINGKINSIDSLPDGRTRINANFPYINDQSIFITNREKLVGISPDPNKPTTFQLELFPSQGFSVRGTQWRGPLMPGAAPSSGSYAYPDLNSIIFLPDKDITVYAKNGQPVMWGTQGTGSYTALQSTFVQRGALVYMAGYNNERAIKEIGYFGVLLPSGDKMMVHSGSQDARLPNYIHTTAPYGPIGATPVIYKE